MRCFAAAFMRQKTRFQTEPERLPIVLLHAISAVFHLKPAP